MESQAFASNNPNEEKELQVSTGSSSGIQITSNKADDESLKGIKHGLNNQPTIFPHTEHQPSLPTLCLEKCLINGKGICFEKNGLVDGR